MPCTYKGRKRIYADTDEITAENVWDVVQGALSTHNTNKADMTFLYNYYKGNQPILNREKEIRPEINNKIVVNRANEIVSFKAGYLLGEPIQYIRRDGNKTQSEDVRRLNDYMLSSSKETKDISLVTWMYIVGTGYRIVLPKTWVGKGKPQDEGEAPFEFYTLDPRECFVAYSRDVGNKPVYACVQSKPADSIIDGDYEYTVYTRNNVFTIKNGKVTLTEENPVGEIPIIEYPENDARLGAFEIVLEILDAINVAESNRLDDIEQTVQALLVLIGVDIEQKDADGNTVNTVAAIRANGGISIPLGSDAKYLTMQLNQGQTQTLVNDLENAWLTICGMPNRNGGTSTSDTGTAVFMRDGHAEAEIRAMNTQRMFSEPENRFVKLCLFIMSQVEPVNITSFDIVPHFNRQNAVNLQSKTQSFCELMASGFISPLWALKISKLAFDTESCYEDGMAWHDEQEEKRIKELQDSLTAQETEQGTDTEEEGGHNGTA